MKYLFPLNHLTRLTLYLALALGVLLVLPSCSSLRWERQSKDKAETHEIKALLAQSAQPLSQPQRVRSFYESRKFRPVWTGNGPGIEEISSLIGAVRHSYLDGFDPTWYRLREIERLSVEKGPASDEARLDILLTDAYFSYAHDLYLGRVNPKALEEEWMIQRSTPDFGQELNAALETRDVVGSLNRFAPQSKDYQDLKTLLAAYVEMARTGGWPTISMGPDLKTGMRSYRVKQLRRRLTTEGLTRDKNKTSRFDRKLARALTQFQIEHSLEPSGVLDFSTLVELNQPVESRINQIRANLERWRWLPRFDRGKYLVVDIAKFELKAVEDGRSVLSMKAIIGKDKTRTPILIDNMSFLVINPRWTIPTSIAVNDLLGKAKRDPDYFESRNMKVFRRKNGQRSIIDPHDIDWSEVTPEHFPYEIVQAPGASNPLGSIKFIFPNPLSIYLHGTTSPQAFHSKIRALSHGCIRIEKPIELASYVLNQDNKNDRWTRERLLAIIKEGKEKVIPLPKPLPVEVLYWTVAATENGRPQFRNDIYHSDAPLLAALNQEEQAVAE